MTSFQTFSVRGLHSANVPGKSKEYSGVHHHIDVIWRRNTIIERQTCYNHEEVLSCASAYVDGVEYEFTWSTWILLPNKQAETDRDSAISSE